LGNYEKTFCANDVGDTEDKKNIVGNRIDVWLPSWLYGVAWGRRNIDISWWYNPSKLCYPGRNPKTQGSFETNVTNCDAEPSVPYPTLESADDLNFATGIKGQIVDASPALKVLLTCLKGKHPTGWVITSISRSGVDAYNYCANNNTWDKPSCLHAQNSCHFGGKNCKDKSKGGGSMAIDVRYDPGGTGEEILAATCECATEYDLGKVTARPEGDGTKEALYHYHISVKNDTCDCDGGAKVSLPNSVCKK